MKQKSGFWFELQIDGFWNGLLISASVWFWVLVSVLIQRRTNTLIIGLFWGSGFQFDGFVGLVSTSFMSFFLLIISSMWFFLKGFLTIYKALNFGSLQFDEKENEKSMFVWWENKGKRDGKKWTKVMVKR